MADQKIEFEQDSKTGHIGFRDQTKPQIQAEGAFRENFTVKFGANWENLYYPTRPYPINHALS